MLQQGRRQAPLFDGGVDDGARVALGGNLVMMDKRSSRPLGCPVSLVPQHRGPLPLLPFCLPILWTSGRGTGLANPVPAKSTRQHLTKHPRRRGGTDP